MLYFKIDNKLNNIVRIILFLFLCIPVRLLISYLPLIINPILFRYLAVLILMISFSFLYLYVNNLRLNAVEGGGLTWWANFRIIHFILYFIAAILLFFKNKIAYIPLLIDTLIGIMLFFLYRK